MHGVRRRGRAPYALCDAQLVLALAEVATLVSDILAPSTAGIYDESGQA